MSDDVGRSRDDERARTALAELASLGMPLPREPAPRPVARWSANPATAAVLLLVPAACFVIAVLSRSATQVWAPFVWIGAVAAFMLAVGSIADRTRKRRIAEKRRLHPDEPWQWDHEWDPRGASLSSIGRVLRALEGRRGGAMIPISMALLVWSAASRAWMPRVLALGPVVTWAAWRFWRVHGAGTATLSYAQFPFHPGEAATLHFGMSEGGATFERVEFHLRFYKSVEDGTHWRRPMQVVAFHVEKQLPPGLLPGPDQEIAVTFDLPAEAVGTRLSDPMPRYWVLDVVANTSAGPYTESFLVPIYERVAARTDAVRT